MSTLLRSNTSPKSMVVNTPRACLSGVSEGMAPLEKKFLLCFSTNCSHHSLFLPDIRNHIIHFFFQTLETIINPKGLRKGSNGQSWWSRSLTETQSVFQHHACNRVTMYQRQRRVVFTPGLLTFPSAAHD